MANTVFSSILYSTAQESLSADFYTGSIEAPVQSPDGFYVDPWATYGSSVFHYGNTVHSTKANQVLLGTIGDNWFNRIHLIPSASKLGNLLSAQTIEIEVWNGFFEAKTLNSITESGTEGIDLTEPAPTPLVYAPFESKIYTVNVAVVGPPTIDGHYSFNFDVYSIVYSVTGKRVVVFAFVPQTQLVETIEFKTDVIQVKAGEQRIALRAYPRNMFQGTFVLDEHKFSRFKAVMTQWGYRKFAFPIWPEISYIGEIAAGDLTVSLDTTKTTHVEGGIALIFQDSTLYESVEVDTMTDSSITFNLPVENDFTKAFVLPIAFMTLNEGATVTRAANKVPVMDALFTGGNFVDISADTGKTQLRGKDVYLQRNMYVSDVTEKLYNDIEVLDNLTGVQILMPNRDFNEHEQTITFDCNTWSEVWSVKQWLYTLKGRQKSFFIPSWNMDLELLVSPITADTSLQIRSINYSLYYAEKDILIVLKDGSKVFLHALSGAIAGAGIENITLDAQVGQDIDLADIEVVSFISHVRMDADRFEIRHGVAGAATISIPIREVPE